MDRFISVNCAAIPESLAESVLFGHKKGAFTGAVADQEGKFDAADGGTLFLDEIGELSLPIQAKILRAVEDGIIDPIGSKKTHKVNVRLICATNRNLAQFVDEGKFRADLYYRLNVGEVHVPPLRRRREDIGRIVLHVVSRINATLPLPKIFTRMALKVLETYDWAGEHPRTGKRAGTYPATFPEKYDRCRGRSVPRCGKRHAGHCPEPMASRDPP